MAPWEAVMAKVLAKDDPLGTALEQMKAAQDLPDEHRAPDHHLRGVLVGRRRAADRRGHPAAHQPAEAARYMSDPERPALLQLIREHELGGRPVAESVEQDHRPVDGRARTASPAVLHGRLEKDGAPRPGPDEDVR